MTWSSETSHGHEQDKIAAIAVPYLQGTALDLGCGMRKVWPTLIGVDSTAVFGGNTCAEIKANIADLDEIEAALIEPDVYWNVSSPLRATVKAMAFSP